MRRMPLVTFAALSLAATTVTFGQGGSPGAAGEPYKLGTFSIDGSEKVGIVLRDSIVVDLAAANTEFERRPGSARVQPPSNMRDLIVQYDRGVSQRIRQIVDALVTGNQLADRRPGHVRNVSAVKTLAPILYPSKMLNAAINYYGHIGETSTPEEQKKIAVAARADRGLPYLFMKPTLGAIIGNGDDIVMPRGRTQIDWECELGIVIGRPAKYVTAAQAYDYIFGYTIQLDMSDRGGRPEKTPKFGGSDWLMGKAHDTFAPMGPWIVPKEFYKNAQDTRQHLTVNGKTMQDSRSSDMIHTIAELIEYGSSVMTLFPGDVIAGGSPSGTGMSRSVRPEQIWLKPGDKIVATIDGIGTMTHTVRADTGGPSVTSSTR